MAIKDGIYIYRKDTDTLEPVSGDVALSKDIKSNTSFGGVETGTTYKAGTTFEDILTSMLVKYIEPSISISISPSTSPLYIGETVSSVTITATVTKQSYDIESVKFYVNATEVEEVTEGVAGGGTFTFRYVPSSPIDSTTTFYASAKDSKKTVNSTSKEIRFVYGSYFGTVAPSVTSPTATDIVVLTKMKQTSRAYTNSNISMSYGKILYAYPKSFGALTSIKDANNVQYINSYTRTEVTINGVDYYCYLLTDGAGVDRFTQIYA